MAETLKNMEARGHERLDDGTYENKQSTLLVLCHEHGEEYLTTFYNYNRCRTGLPCCGRAQVSQKLMKRTFIEETLQKMKIAAINRPLRGGMPQDWRKT